MVVVSESANADYNEVRLHGCVYPQLKAPSTQQQSPSPSFTLLFVGVIAEPLRSLFKLAIVQ